MPTIKNPVHVYVDEIEVFNGPSEAGLLTLPKWEDCYDHELCSVKMTLTTALSKRMFQRKVVITNVEPEYTTTYPEESEDFVEAISGQQELTGRHHITGFIGNWYFTGLYDPRTRKGTLTEVDH